MISAEANDEKKSNLEITHWITKEFGRMIRRGKGAGVNRPAALPRAFCLQTNLTIRFDLAEILSSKME